MRSRIAPQTQSLVEASFRDPAGFIFRDKDGSMLRQINQTGRQDYELFMSTGLYKSLAEAKQIVRHTEADRSRALTVDAWSVIIPTFVPTISYPFEWSFTQLKDAALLTLAIQKRALQHGMTLKDASAYNVQFVSGKPVFIDTLSFEKYKKGKAWQAYKQFCQHFLAPLALMSYTDYSMSQLLRVHLDGIPLDLARKLLPRKAKIRPGIAMHIVIHGRAQRSKATDNQPPKSVVSQTSLEAIIDSLERAVKKLSPRHDSTEWGDYYHHTNYTVAATDEKAKSVVNLIKPLGAKLVLDLGGNNGKYSRVLNELGISTICTDIDPIAVEANYNFIKQYGETLMLPMVVDLTNPGGAIGWSNKEREPLHKRIQVDVVMALALVHHLSISNNLPFEKLAEYFSKFGEYLVLEFVPKTDSQVHKLLSTREDIFPHYDATSLISEFDKYFTLVKESDIRGSQRTLYLFKRRLRGTE